MASVPISKVTPDFQQLYDALRRKLAQEKTWIDLLPTSVGSTLLDLFAGSGVSNQLYIDIAFREAFLPTAVRDSSIFAGARMLGVNIARKTSASTVCSLTNLSDKTQFIYPYSSLTVGAAQFFNRVQYVLKPNETILNVKLYQGYVNTKTFDLSRYPSLHLREFLLGEPGFVVTSLDLVVYTQNKTSKVISVWNKTDKALFEHDSEDAVFYESTTRDGDTSLLFGDGEYGKLLSAEDNLVVKYVRTNGAESNQGLPGIKVTDVNNAEITGENTSSISGGSDEKSALYYKLFAANMARTKRRAISGSDIRSVIMNYPGVADVSIMGQRDIAPNDLRWMNMFRVCILPEESDTIGGANPNPTSAAWTQFIDWLHPHLHNAYDVQRWNPEKVFVSVRVTLALFPTATGNDIKLIALEKILKLFEKKPGSLGRRLSQSDITEALRGIEGVDYVKVESPREEITMPNANYYAVLEGEPVVDVVYSERAIGVTGAY